MGRLDEVEESWQHEAEAVLSGIKEWRQAHPRATLAEMEQALDERLSAMRARLLEDLALASRAAEVAAASAEERPRCPRCGGVLQARGRGERTVITQGDRPIRLRRSYAVCTACGGGLFPPG